MKFPARKKDNGYANGNMAVAEFMQGNVEKAYDDISSAIGSNLPSKAVYGFNGTKGALEIKLAKYQDAVKTLSNAEENADNMFNKGLAQVLAKDYQNAVITFDELTDDHNDYAMAYYGAAVASARLSKADDVVSYVKKAVNADPSLKSKAAGDLEFDKYTSNSDFISAVK